MAAADHLQVPRQHGLFYHHGIDLGDGSVAHYLEGREILRSSIKDFCQGNNFIIIQHQKPDSKSITLTRAKGRIGEKNYNLLFNNCEHFANWCKTGIHQSHQMNNILSGSVKGLLSISNFLPLGFIPRLKILLNQSFFDTRSENRIKKELETLKKIRSSLQIKLDSTLEKLVVKLQSESQFIKFRNNDPYSRNLMKAGQGLADALTALEDLEGRITTLLNNSNSQN